jgi:hypothetical protein
MQRITTRRPGDLRPGSAEAHDVNVAVEVATQLLSPRACPREETLDVPFRAFSPRSVLPRHRLLGDFRLRPFRQLDFKGGQDLPDEQIMSYQGGDL